MLHKKTLLIAVLYIISFYANAQKSKKNVVYNKSNPLKKSDTLVIVPPFVFMGKSEDYLKVATNYPKVYEDSAYVIDDKKSSEKETYYRNCFYMAYRYYFSYARNYYIKNPLRLQTYLDSQLILPVATKYTATSKNYVVLVSPEDYSIIHDELKIVEKQLNDTLTMNLEISALMYNTLFKYCSTYCLLTDFKEYEYTGKKNKPYNSTYFWRTIIIDMKQQRVYFYDYQSLANKYHTIYGTQFSHENDKYGLLGIPIHLSIEK
jgi:hypothetical protein